MVAGESVEGSRPQETRVHGQRLVEPFPDGRRSGCWSGWRGPWSVTTPGAAGCGGWLRLREKGGQVPRRRRCSVLRRGGAGSAGDRSCGQAACR